MYIVWWILLVFFSFLGIVGLVGIINPNFFNKELKDSQKPFTKKLGIVTFILSLVFIIVLGSIVTSHKTSNQSHVQKTSKQETKVVEATKPEKHTTKTVKAEPKKNKNVFSVDNPVPDSYLVDFLTYMDSYYNELVNRINSGALVDPVENGKFLSEHNKQGWDIYNKITYKTDFTKEKDDQQTKRTDVATAWTCLTTLGMDYDEFVQGLKGKNDLAALKKDEDEYLQAYKVAKGHF